MSKWMILGGAGCFGLHLARHLLRVPGHAVVSVGRNPWPQPCWTLGLEPDGAHLRYEQVHIAFEVERLLRLMDEVRPEVVVNFAALAYATSWHDAALYYRTNLVAVAQIAEWLTGKGWLGRWLQIGTSELYGSTDAPATEDAPPNPTSPYAVSKLAADMHLQTLVARGFPAVIARPSNCYGPAQLMYRVLPRAAWCALAGHRLPLEGGGAVRKSYLHASDLASALAKIAWAKPGTVWNIGPPEPITIAQLVHHVADVAGIPFDELIKPERPREGEDKCYWLDSSRIREAYGWTERVGLKEGVAEVVEWVREWRHALPAPAPFVLRG